MRLPIRKFNQGLVTPLVDARTDSEEYQAACRVLDNFIARVQGAAERRPGTYYINGMRSSDDTTPVSGVTTCLLVPFIYNKTIAYVLEFTGYYIRVFYNDAVVDTITTTYAESDLFDLQFHQDGNLVWITSGSYAQAQLRRIDSTTFELDDIIFNDGPFLKRNDLSTKDGITLDIAGTGLTLTAESTCVYSASVKSSAAYKAFDGIISSFWEVRTITNTWISCQWTTGQNIKRVRVNAYRLKVFKVQASNDGSAWTEIPVLSCTGNGEVYDGGTYTGCQITESKSGWVDVVLDNDTTYTYWRVYNISGYDVGDIRRIYEIQVSDSATAESDDNAVLTASGDLFDADHVGALFAITQPRVNCSISISKTETGYSDEILVEGAAVLSIATGWKATVKLEKKSKEESAWRTVSQWVSYDAKRAIQYGFSESEYNVYYRVNVSAYTSGTVAGELTVNEPEHTGICRILTVNSATSADVDVVKDFVSGEVSSMWAEGCWSTYRGFPTGVTFIEGRCVYGGMKNLADGTKKATLWLSASDNYNSFAEGVKGGNSFSVTIDTTETLVWVDTLDNLLTGTTGGIFMTRSSRMDLPMTPDPPPITRQLSAYPCSDIKPVKANKTLIYVSGRQLRELSYDRNSAMYDSDLTSKCEQITESKIVNMSVQTNPQTIIWCVHADGRLSSFVYDRENGVMAWSKMPLAVTSGVDPDVKSVCVIPDYGVGDDIYVAVNRTITGKTMVMGSEDMYYGDDLLTWKLYPIYVEKMAKRFE